MWTHSCRMRLARYPVRPRSYRSAATRAPPANGGTALSRGLSVFKPCAHWFLDLPGGTAWFCCIGPKRPACHHLEACARSGGRVTEPGRPRSHGCTGTSPMICIFVSLGEVDSERRDDRRRSEHSSADIAMHSSQLRICGQPSHCSLRNPATAHGDRRRVEAERATG